MKADRESQQPTGTKKRSTRRRTDKIQLLLVDEHPLQRAGVRTLLQTETDVVVVGEANSIDEAVGLCTETMPDVVLMNLDEATTETVADMQRLREQCPTGALVVMTRHEDDEEVYRAVVGGAAGHVGDNAQPEELVNTVRSAAAGDDPISQTLARRPAVGRRVLESYAQMVARGPSAHEPRLTERELTILGHAALGMTNQQIGRALSVSEHTIKSDISRVLARLGLRHRTEAVVYAMRNGWITRSHVPAADEPRDSRFAG